MDEKWHEIIYYDERGDEYVLDEAGNHRPPMQTTKYQIVNGFLTYDDSKGHCALCGKLTCRGSCFR